MLSAATNSPATATTIPSVGTPPNRLAPPAAYHYVQLYPLYYPLAPQLVPAGAGVAPGPPPVHGRSTAQAAAVDPDLPAIIPDCLEHVFRYLSSRDKGRAARVCRLWRDTCYRRSVWRGCVARLRLSRSANGVLHSVQARGVRKVRVRDHRCDVERVTRIFTSLEGLDLSGCYYTTDETLQRAFWCEMPGLTSLDLSYCGAVTDAGVSSAVDKCPNLRSLSLRGCPNVNLNNGAKRALKRCAALGSLDLSGCKQLFYTAILGLFDEDGVNSLEELRLRDCDHICDLCLKYIGRSLANSLRSIDLSFCISVTDFGLEEIASRLLRLEVLKLQSVDNITPRGMEFVAARCARLRVLDVGFCDWVKDDCLELLARGRVADSLEELSLKCTRVTDRGIGAIADSLHRLQCLVIGQCTRLTDRSAEVIGANLAGLVTIDLYGCCFSPEAIGSLREALPNLVNASNSML